MSGAKAPIEYKSDWVMRGGPNNKVRKYYNLECIPRAKQNLDNAYVNQLNQTGNMPTGDFVLSKVRFSNYNNTNKVFMVVTTCLLKMYDEEFDNVKTNRYIQCQKTNANGKIEAENIKISNGSTTGSFVYATSGGDITIKNIEVRNTSGTYFVVCDGTGSGYNSKATIDGNIYYTGNTNSQAFALVNTAGNSIYIKGNECIIDNNKFNNADGEKGVICINNVNGTLEVSVGTISIINNNILSKGIIANRAGQMTFTNNVKNLNISNNNCKGQIIFNRTSGALNILAASTSVTNNIMTKWNTDSTHFFYSNGTAQTTFDTDLVVKNNTIPNAFIYPS